MDEGEKQRRRRTPLDHASDAASRIVFFAAQRSIPSVISGLGLPILIVFGVIILLAFLIIIPGGGGVGTSPSGPETTPTPPPIAGAPSPAPITGLTIQKTGPRGETDAFSINNGEDISYTIKVTYTGNQDVSIRDDISPHTSLVSANGINRSERERDKVKTVIWPLKENVPKTATDTQKTYEFTLIVRPNNENITVTNRAYATISADVSCAGIYLPDIEKLKQHGETLKNFGDPLCTLKKDTNKIAASLNDLDPQNAAKWFIILGCESSYSPNAFNPQSTEGTAWGLMQMHKEGKSNRLYDRGDVPWEQQLSNGINYNKSVIGGSFRYWSCAEKNGFVK